MNQLVWWVACTLIAVQVVTAEEYTYEDDAYRDEEPDFYDTDEEEIVSPSSRRPAIDSEALARVRRFGQRISARSLELNGLDDVKGALKQLFAGRKVGRAITMVAYEDDNVDRFPDGYTSPSGTTEFTARIYFPNDTLRVTKDRVRPPTRSRSFDLTGAEDYERSGNAALRDDDKTTTSTQSTSSTSSTTSTSSSSSTTSTSSAGSTTTKSSSNSSQSTTAAKTTKSPRFDIEALLALVANLTYDYDTNLTFELNETLQRFSIPTCKTPTTTVTTTTLATTEAFYNTTVVSKCFVCGLQAPGIPRNAYCADAFATDFLPLVPIDPKAKGLIARFRKYCRYFDVYNYQLNKSDPRAMLGRWTGGCAVRWIDLSGVYTQRVCRNRLRPVTGTHYASKRMAKLELALSNVDEGCIISPMATLVPFSRGISLYARFHACVCTGNWCNKATLPALGIVTMLLYLILIKIIK